MYRLARGNLEKEMDLLQLLVGSGDHVVDVGGNRGTYAYRLRNLGAVVDVFEPNPVCLRPLEQWASGKSSVKIHAIGLSNGSGNTHLRIPVDDRRVEHDSSASIEDSVQGNIREQSITLRSLDSYDFGDVALIKIDVEGHECSVIEGAAKTLESSSPALIVEIEQRHCAKPITDVFNKILDFGYVGFFLFHDKLTPLVRFDLESDSKRYA